MRAPEKPSGKIDPALASAVWIWGRARDFAREGYAAKAPEKLFQQRTHSMRADVASTAPQMRAFFKRLTDELAGKGGKA